MSTISTLARQNLFLQSIAQLQTQANTLESQVSKGIKSTQLSGLGASAAEITNLQNEVSQNQSYLDTISTVQQNVQENSTVLSNIESAVTNFTSGLPDSAFTTSPNTIQTTAKQLLQEVGDFINTQGANGYIFSGSLTGTAPFDTSGLPNPGSLTSSVSGAPPSGYYTGNNTAASATIDNNLTIQYGVTGNNPALENIIRVLNFFANLPPGSPNANSPTDQANVGQAQTLLTQGVAGLQQAIGKLASQTSELSQVQHQHQGMITLAQTNLTNIEAVDPATVISQLNQLETTMQASFTTISDLQKLSLVNYLPVG